jgi:ABC-type multidrug transport system ATPase subunit
LNRRGSPSELPKGDEHRDDGSMTITTTSAPPTAASPPATPAIEARAVQLRHAGGTVGLDDVNLAIHPGTVTAIIGPSGAGKSTLLEVLAGVRRPTSGTVAVRDADRIGFVPQEDILHTALPLRRTLRHAAALRLPSTAGATQIDAAVDRALAVLGLSHRADVPVGRLSGGERKRASVACELLTDPKLCLLDEPTSGLDPVAAADLLDQLAVLARQGSTIVLTTHAGDDLAWCDQVVAVAPGGRIAATGSAAEVLDALAATTFAELHRRLERQAPAPAALDSDRSRASRRLRSAPTPRTHGAGWFRQWLVLTRRSTELVVHDKLTLAILLGSPAAVTAMMATLFGARPAVDDPAQLALIGYWLAFAAFFFGLTFGLLQVCTEASILRREHHVGVRTGAYLASKVALLAPLVFAVIIGMVAVLVVTDRLPTLSGGELAGLLASMALLGAVALLLGLAASAAVETPAQAALALPMLCFPAVLFGGSVVPVALMSGVGRVMAAIVPTRWGFEAVSDHLGANALVGGSTGHSAIVLLASAVIVTATARIAIGRRAST